MQYVADSDSDKDFDDVFSKKTEKGDPKTEPPKPQVSDEDDDDEIENGEAYLLLISILFIQ